MNTFFQNFSIRLRFNILLLSIIAILISVAVFFIITLNNVQNFRDYKQNIDQLTIHYLNLRRFEQHFLLRYPEDPAFFTTGKNKYLKKHENSSDNFLKVLSELRTNNISEDLKLNEFLNKIEVYQTNYNKIFSDLSDKIYERGSKNTGVIGKMKIASSFGYTNTNNTNIKSYMFDLMQINESYLFNNDKLYYQEFLDKFKELHDYIKANFSSYYQNNTPELNINDSTITEADTLMISSSNKINRELIKNINDFKNHFSALLKIDTEIGLSYQEGLSGDLRTEIHKIDPEIDMLIAKVEIAKQEAVKSTKSWVIVFFIIITLVIITTLWRFSNSITVPLNKLRGYLVPLSRGKLPENVTELKGKDEISEMTQSINDLITGLKKTTDFATTIGRGVFDTHYEPLSSEDALGNSLIEMHQNLNQAKIEEEKRKREDDLRKWTNEGLAKFNDMLRQSTGDIEILSNLVIRELVYFLNANQGGLFIYNDNDSNNAFLELSAAYAFGKEKKKEKIIYPGEGLVGTAAVEKETVYMTDIPETYITISSGLGGANPRSLLIVPMRVEDKVFGVIEIASFSELNSHEISFVEEVSENIAASLSITRINTRTSELLEQSQLTAEQMAAQEKEMRLNFEELQQTQEDSAIREAEMASILSAIDSSSYVIELNVQGYITSVNRAFLDLVGLSDERFINKHHKEIIVPEDDTEYNIFWNKIRNGENLQKTEYIKMNENEYWFSVIYAPILDDVGNVQRILSLATDLTESKKLEIETREQAEAMLAQEEEMRQNLEELHSTQEEMAKKQAMLEEANLKSRTNEKALKKTVDKTKKQEQELQLKVNELNEIQKQLQEQHDKIIDINNELAKKESEIRDRFNAVDKNNLVAEYNIDGTLITANETFLTLFGYELKELKNKHHRMLLYEDDRKLKEYKTFWNELRKGRAFDSEYRRIKKNGEILFFRGIYTPIKDIKGKPYKILEILSDITKLKYTEARHESRMKNINQTNTLIEFDKFGSIVDVNEHFCEAIGYTEKELIGQNHKIFISPDELEKEDYRHFWRNLTRGDYKTDMFELIAKDKSTIYMQGTYSALKDPQGEIKKIMFLAYNMTGIITNKEEISKLEEKYKNEIKTLKDKINKLSK